MRVALYHPWIYLKGGAERTLLELVHLSRHKIDIYTHRYEPDNTFPEFRQLNVTELKPRVEVKREFSQIMNAGRIVAAAKLPLEKYDLLIVSTSGIGEFITLNNHGRVPILALCHTPLRAVHEPQTRSVFLAARTALGRAAFLGLERIYNTLEKKSWQYIDHVAANSETTRQRILNGHLCSKEKITVQHPGVKLEAFSPDTKPGRYFFCPGRIMRQKRIELAIEAFEQFKQLWRGPAFELVVAGALDDKSRDYYHALKKQAQAIGKVRFEINPTDRQLRTRYERSYAVLLTAINEDWGITPLEGMAAGRPVVAVNEGGFKISVRNGKTGVLVPAKAEQLAKAMYLLAHNPAMARKMGQAGRRRVQQFSWAAFAQGLDRVIDRTARL